MSVLQLTVEISLPWVQFICDDSIPNLCLFLHVVISIRAGDIRLEFALHVLSILQSNHLEVEVELGN